MQRVSRVDVRVDGFDDCFGELAVLEVHEGRERGVSDRLARASPATDEVADRASAASPTPPPQQPSDPADATPSLAGLAERLGLALVVVSGGRLTYANQSAARLFGYPSASAMCALASAELLIAGAERRTFGRIAEELVARGKAPQLHVATAACADGRRIQVEILPCVTEWLGRPALGVAVLDLTGRRDADRLAKSELAELAHFDRICTLGQRSATIVHEIAQPLTALSMATGALHRLLEAREPDRTSAIRAAQMIDSQAKRMRDTLDRIRHFAAGNGRNRATPEAIEIGSVIDQAILITEPALRRAGVVSRVRCATEPGRLRVMADSVQLSQVLVNLLNNAADAIASSARETGTVTVRVRLLGPSVVVDVMDDGPGIPADQVRRIFEAFFSTKQSGMGVGLTVCRSIVESCGGRLLALRVPPGAGAVFRMRLPQHGGGHG